MTTNTAPHTIGSDLVAAIEGFWTSLVEWFPELPASIVVVTGSGRVRGGLIRGHAATDRWTTTEGRVAELFVSGERIADGGRGVATTIIHEAAHLLLAARGDATMGTSRQFRYHTRSGFAAAAEELGLVAPAKADPVLGFSDCTMPDVTAEMFAADIERLDEVLSARIVMVGMAELIAGAIAVGAILGGLNVVVPWWKDGDVVSLWGTLGGGVSTVKPRKPRAAKIRVACDCRELKCAESELELYTDLTCGRCGTEMIVAL